MKTLFGYFLLATLFLSCSPKSLSKQADDDDKLISIEEYQQKVYAYWIGQVIGNTYGLGYEFAYINEPGPDKFPLGYVPWTLESLKKCNGAFSDDDTDIEYMYLSQMEKNGIEPTYFNLAEAWKSSVKSKVWCANRAAVTLMHAGYYPPITGSKEYNVQWCQIDPQLVNEIWAVTAPGMTKYAVDKSEFAARITSDSIGLEPTLHYAAMYSAAFFESDVNKLVDIGTAALPVNCDFAKTVSYVKQLYAQYPNDWKIARKKVKEAYFDSCHRNSSVWNVVDANLNGAMGILALLYGQGDFQRTLDLCCSFGMDCDNQAATICGLLGVAKGFDSIPKDLMFPLNDLKWAQPFNNYYKMVTRDGLYDDSLTNIAKRIAVQGEKIILAQGGAIVDKDGNKYYRISSSSKFVAPFELNPLPTFYVEKDKAFSFPIYTGGSAGSVSLKVVGQLPPGMVLRDSKLCGVPSIAGVYNFKVTASCGLVEKSVDVQMTVHSINLAQFASKVLYNESAMDKNVELIRDGLYDKTYYSVKRDSEQCIDFYGYSWNKLQKISTVCYNNGAPSEFCGWFTTFSVEYLKDDKWVKVDDYTVFPKMNLDNSQWLKASFINYNISFAPIETKGIRIVGLSGGIEKDAANAALGMQYYSSISELSVFEN